MALLLRNQPPRPGGPESRLPRVQTRVPERDGEAARLVTERPCPRNGPSTCGHGHRVTCRQQPSGGGATPRPPTHTQLQSLPWKGNGESSDDAWGRQEL